MADSATLLDADDLRDIANILATDIGRPLLLEYDRARAASPPDPQRVAALDLLLSRNVEYVAGLLHLARKVTRTKAPTAWGYRTRHP